MAKIVFDSDNEESTNARLNEIISAATPQQEDKNDASSDDEAPDAMDTLKRDPMPKTAVKESPKKKRRVRKAKSEPAETPIETIVVPTMEPLPDVLLEALEHEEPENPSAITTHVSRKVKRDFADMVDESGNAIIALDSDAMSAKSKDFIHPLDARRNSVKRVQGQTAFARANRQRIPSKFSSKKK